MSAVSVRFHRIDADGTHVLVHVSVSVDVMGVKLDRPYTVRFTEERAHAIVGEFHAAIAKLGRGRLGSGA